MTAGAERLVEIGARRHLLGSEIGRWDIGHRGDHPQRRHAWHRSPLADTALRASQQLPPSKKAKGWPVDTVEGLWSEPGIPRALRCEFRNVGGLTGFKPRPSPPSSLAE